MTSVVSQNRSDGEKTETCLGDCSAGSQQGERRRKRPSIVAERMETLTQPDSILPVRSWWQHSDKLLLNYSQRLSCPVLPDQNYSPLLNTSVAYFHTTAHRFDDGTVSRACECVHWCLFDLIKHLCWRVTCGKCHCSFVCVDCMKYVWAFSTVTPEWTLECHTHIEPLSLCHLLWPPLAGCLHFSTHSIHSTVSVHLNTKSAFGWKPWQWLVTAAVTRHHSHHCTGQSFCRQLQNHSVFLPWPLKKCITLWFLSFLILQSLNRGLCLITNGCLALFQGEMYAAACLNNSWELNLEVFILDIYLAYDHQSGSCQPC